MGIRKLATNNVANIPFDSLHFRAIWVIVYLCCHHAQGPRPHKTHPQLCGNDTAGARPITSRETAQRRRKKEEKHEQQLSVCEIPTTFSANMLTQPSITAKDSMKS